MVMKTEETWTATIYVGFHHADGCWGMDDINRLCQAFVNDNPGCVTITPTTFVYVGGQEPGAAIGLINYPRFPKACAWLKTNALALAAVLLGSLKQNRVIVVMPDETVVLTNETE